jgi:hypothetical protein
MQIVASLLQLRFHILCKRAFSFISEASDAFRVDSSSGGRSLRLLCLSVCLSVPPPFHSLPIVATFGSGPTKPGKTLNSASYSPRPLELHLILNSIPSLAT